MRGEGLNPGVECLPMQPTTLSNAQQRGSAPAGPPHLRDGGQLLGGRRGRRLRSLRTLPLLWR